jgi:hypothetical protein
VAPLSWTVTGQVTGQTIIDEAGNVIVGSYVFFTTGEGNKDSVFVPDAKRTKQNVTDLIHAQAQLADEIGRLSHKG